MRIQFFAFVIAGFLCVSPLRAEFLDVEIGDLDLLPNTAGQVVDIRIFGDGKVQGLNFDVQLGNGKTGEFPAITNVDIVGPDVLFGPDNTGDNGPKSGASYGYAGFWSSVTTTTGAGTGTVTPEPGGSILAKVEISTVGFFEGFSFDLILNNGVDVLTNFAGWGSDAGEDLNIQPSGTVNIVNPVPEPSTCLLFLGGCLGLGFVVLRKRR